MDQSLTSAHGTAPPTGTRTRCITLGDIPRYVELYRKSGKPPRVNVNRPWRFDRIDLTTHERWVLKLSDGRTFTLKPGTNRFNPPIELEAGAWFVIHMAAKASGRVRLPLQGLSGWVDEDDFFDSLLPPDEPERDESVEREGTAADEELALPNFHALEDRAEQSDPAPAPVDHPVVSTKSAAPIPPPPVHLRSKPAHGGAPCAAQTEGVLPGRGMRADTNANVSGNAGSTCDRAEYEAAREEELRTLRLSDTERDLFMKAMESPPEPTEAFKRAVIRHSELIKNEEKQP